MAFSGELWRFIRVLIVSVNVIRSLQLSGLGLCPTCLVPWSAPFEMKRCAHESSSNFSNQVMGYTIMCCVGCFCHVDLFSRHEYVSASRLRRCGVWCFSICITLLVFVAWPTFTQVLNFVFEDLQQNPLDAPIFTLPNPSSEPGFHKCAPLEYSQVPRWCLWLKASASPLNKLGPLAPLLSFLLPTAPSRQAKALIEAADKFEGNHADFLNWRFGPNNPKHWNIMKQENNWSCYRIDKDVMQIGLWPQDCEEIAPFATQMVSIARQKNCGRIEWAGECTTEFESHLTACGFRTSFFGKNTWRNALFKNETVTSPIQRQQFDTWSGNFWPNFCVLKNISYT